MCVSARSAHLEDEILKTRRLGCRPVYPTNEISGRDAGGIKYQIADLSIEDIRRAIGGVCGRVRIGINECNST
jgi:hypothetical protein